MGHRTTSWWYTHGKAGRGISNGDFRAAFRVREPQQVYGAETMACAVASNLAQPGDEIIVDKQGVVKATPIPDRGVVKDPDYLIQCYHTVTTKNLIVRWTPGHRDLRNATTRRDYSDIQGNNNSDTLANMGDNLPVGLPPPKPHNIALHGHITHPPNLG